MSSYSVFYIDSDHRIEAMLVCSLNGRINWCEEGSRMLDWKYTEVYSGEAESVNDVFKRHSVLDIDRRRKKNSRAMTLADAVVFDGQPWIVTAFGFVKVPDVLWSKMI